MVHRTLPALAIGLLAFAHVSAHAVNECSVTSPKHRVALVELFTSEGCSSCPPADDWLSKTLTKRYPSNQAVALAWHVDYWDSLGWKDVFAQRAFTQRQYGLRNAGLTSGVYTPQVLISGQEMQKWRSEGRVNESIQALNQTPSPLQIKLNVEGDGGQFTVKANFNWAQESLSETSAQAYIAVFEDGRVSPVKSGENSGAVLRHDRVVRQWAGPFQLNKNGAQTQFTFKPQPGWNVSALGVAGFAEGAARTPIQVVALDRLSPPCR